MHLGRSYKKLCHKCQWRALPVPVPLRAPRLDGPPAAGRSPGKVSRRFGDRYRRFQLAFGRGMSECLAVPAVRPLRGVAREAVWRTDPAEQFHQPAEDELRAGRCGHRLRRALLCGIRAGRDLPRPRDRRRPRVVARGARLCRARADADALGRSRHVLAATGGQRRAAHRIAGPEVAGGTCAARRRRRSGPAGLPGDDGPDRAAGAVRQHRGGRGGGLSGLRCPAPWRAGARIRSRPIRPIGSAASGEGRSGR